MSLRFLQKSDIEDKPLYQYDAELLKKINEFEEELHAACYDCPNCDECCKEVKHATFRRWFSGENKQEPWLLSLGGKCKVFLVDEEFVLKKHDCLTAEKEKRNA